MAQSHDTRYTERLNNWMGKWPRRRSHSSSRDHDEVVSFHEPDVSPRSRDASEGVTWSVRVAAAWSWRLLIIIAAVAVVAWGAVQLSLIVFPVAIAVLLTVLLEPLVRFLHVKVRLPQTAAAATGLVVALLVVVTIIAGAAGQLIRQVPSLVSKASQGLDKAVEWVSNGPFGLETATIEQGIETIRTEVTQFLSAHSSALATGALSLTSSLASVLTGSLIMLFCLFFFMREGRRIWLWVVRLFPAPARRPVHESAIRGWVTLSAYVRTQIKVAAIDAIGIGIGAWALGVPMAIPITVLVFFGSFIPIVGALVSGTIAVLVALVDQGVARALFMLLIILAVQQIEGSILQPWLMSSAVSLHPVAVLLVVAGAGAVAGIPGALFGVPIAAFLNSTFLYLHGYDPIPALRDQEDRPGGPPGMLDEMVAQSYASDDDEDGDGIKDNKNEAVKSDSDEDTSHSGSHADAHDSHADDDRAQGDSNEIAAARGGSSSDEGDPAGSSSSTR